MDKKATKTLVSNTFIMYLLSITKLIVPLISLPYLTRVLSVDVYGSVSFVKSIISYAQIIIDFGFVLSGTKDIVNLIAKKENINREVGSIFYAQLFLSIVAFAGVIICSLVFEILDGMFLFVILSFVPAFLSIFLFEYVFRAIEKMGVITIRFVVMKVLALILTIIFVKSDNDIILIPIFDIISSIISVIPVFFQFKRLNIACEFCIKRIKDAWISLKGAFVYFLSNFVSLAFTSFNVIIIGIFLSKTDTAHFSLSFQLVTAVTVLYNPIITSVYPTMLKFKNLKLIHKILIIYMPLILIGCLVVALFADEIISWVFTSDYIVSARLFKYLIPVLIASFLSLIYGWPCLGIIDKKKEHLITIVIASVVQVSGVIALILFNAINFVNLIIVRCISEILLALLKIIVVYRNKKMFVENIEKES